MSISTSDELKTAVRNWSNRPDLDDRFGEFVALFEAKANRRLRVRSMESSFFAALATDGTAPLRPDFLAFKELRYDGSPSYALEPRPLQWVLDHADQSSAPMYFAVSSGQVVCWPQSGSVTGTYYASIPSLTTNSTNWLLTAHPGVYLYGCMEQIGFYLRDQTMLQVASAQVEALFNEINGSDAANALSGGPLQIRPRGGG